MFDLPRLIGWRTERPGFRPPWPVWHEFTGKNLFGSGPSLGNLERGSRGENSYLHLKWFRFVASSFYASAWVHEEFGKIGFDRSEVRGGGTSCERTKPDIQTSQLPASDRGDLAERRQDKCIPDGAEIILR